MLMQLRGMDYRHDPVTQALRRIGAASIMNRKVQYSVVNVTREKAQYLANSDAE